MESELSLKVNNVESDKSFIQLYNRTNRLISAVFLVVNVVENNDQLKNRIKELSMRLMSVCVELKDEKDSTLRALLSQVQKIVLELLSLLEISSVSGLVSEMNASVLKQEFESFLKSISEFSINTVQAESDRMKEIIAGNDFIDGAVVTTRAKEGNSPKATSEAALKTQSAPLVIKDENKGQNRKNSRQIAILEFVRNHPNANIKDIAPNIRGCGEKTIQRELVELVKMGKVGRIGERRWSRYSVA